MTRPSSRSLIGPLILSLLVSMATAQSDKDPTDAEIQKKCGFSLAKIHDCKFTACLTGNINCEQEGKTPTEIADCQADKCIEAKKTCEKPLIEHLSTEENCEGDKFSAVDGDCLKNHRDSLTKLIDCKTNGYLEAKRKCFESEYHKRIQEEAKKKFGKETCPEALSCTLKNCYNDIEKCLREYHRNVSINPAKYRKFSLKTCSFVALNYPHKCERFTKVKENSCANELEKCEEKCVAESNTGMIVGALVAVVIIALIVGGFLVYRNRKAKQRRGRV